MRGIKVKAGRVVVHVFDLSEIRGLYFSGVIVFIPQR